MARYLLTLFLSFCAVAMALAQQCDNPRYRQRVFHQSFKTSNVVYGNAPSLPPTVYLGESVTQNIDLTMDVFQPFGDTLQKRPLVILAFGGAFLIGSKDDGDMQAVCDSLARRGYVTASINYRLGMNVVDATSAERAIYRSLQDFSAAVRYFKEHADQYGIDTNYIYAGGVSAGGFAALHMALMDESDRLPSSFGASGLNGRPDLGCKDCSGNSYAHSSKVRGLVSFWGALGDVNFIKPTNVLPLVSFHGDQDLIVPYGTGFPFTALFVLPQVSGSAAINQRYNQLGAYNDFTTFEGVGHNIWGLVVTNNFTPNQYFQPIYNHTADFLYEQTRPEPPNISGPDTVCPNTVVAYGMGNRVGERYCWQVAGGQIIRNLGNSIEVYWGQSAPGMVTVKTINHLDAESHADTLAVVIRPAAVAVIETPGGTAVCAGDSVQLSSLFGGAHYTWQPATYYNNANARQVQLAPIISGLYYLQVTDTNGCIAKDSVYITVEATPLPPTITQQGDSLVAEAGSGNLFWYDGNGTLLATGGSYRPTQDGTYRVEEVLANGCGKTSEPYGFITSALPAGLQAGIGIYPNPAGDVVVVKVFGQGTMTVTDVTGKTVAIYPIWNNASINVSALQGGIYLYRIDMDGQQYQGRLVKY